MGSSTVVVVEVYKIFIIIIELYLGRLKLLQRFQTTDHHVIELAGSQYL